jgi:hypothetical protein
MERDLWGKQTKVTVVPVSGKRQIGSIKRPVPERLLQLTFLSQTGLTLCGAQVLRSKMNAAVDAYEAR